MNQPSQQTQNEDETPDVVAHSDDEELPYCGTFNCSTYAEE